MSKYIDADHLKVEIERLNSLVPYENKDRHNEGLHDAYKAVKNVIDSLQQEQPEKSKKDCNNCPHCVDRKDQYGWHFKGCFGGPYKGKFIAEIDECPLEQEQPEVDLEEEAVMFCFDNGINITPGQAKEIASYFYALGLNGRKED